MLFNDNDIKIAQDKASEVCKAGKDYIAENAEDVMWLICKMNQMIGILHLEIKGEKQYNEWVQKHRIKGYLSGYATRCMSADYLIARQSDELYEKEKIALRKLANNPILSNDVKKVLRRAEWMINCALWDHHQVIRFQEKERKEKQKKKGYFIDEE